MGGVESFRQHRGQNSSVCAPSDDVRGENDSAPVEFQTQREPLSGPHVAPKQSYDGGRLAEKVPSAKVIKLYEKDRSTISQSGSIEDSARLAGVVAGFKPDLVISAHAD